MFLAFENYFLIKTESYPDGTYLDRKDVYLNENSANTQLQISDAKFSYDNELLVLATKDNQMLYYHSSTCHIHALSKIHEYDMNLDEYGASVMVNINWGSKSTQFHGTGMRDHRNIVEESIPLSVWDDRQCCIEWRHDDNFFAINIVSPKGFFIDFIEFDFYFPFFYRC